MASEPKYQIFTANDGVSLPYAMREWAYNAFDERMESPLFDTWQKAMDHAIECGIGRKTSEADTYELDPDVQIKAVRDGQ